MHSPPLYKQKETSQTYQFSYFLDGCSSVKLTRIFTVDGRKNGLQEVLSKRRKVSHFVHILFLREHSQIPKHQHDVFSLSQVEQKPFFFIATTTIRVALNGFKVLSLEGSGRTCRLKLILVWTKNSRTLFVSRKFGKLIAFSNHVLTK